MRKKREKDRESPPIVREASVRLILGWRERGILQYAIPYSSFLLVPSGFWSSMPEKSRSFTMSMSIFTVESHTLSYRLMSSCALLIFCLMALAKRTQPRMATK